MRTIALILVAASPAAGQGVIFALSGTTSPTLHRLNASSGALIASYPVTGHQALRGGMAFIYADAGLTAIDGALDGNPDRLVTINPQSGAVTIRPVIGTEWTRHSVIYGDSTSFLAIGDNSLYRINRTTGQTTMIAPLSGSPRLDQVTALGVSDSNEAYITDTIDTDLFRLNLFNGQVTWIGSIGQSDNPFLDLSGYTAGSLIGVRANGGIYSISLSTAAQSLLFQGNYTAVEYVSSGAPFCYANCDESTTLPVLSANDFLCFLNKFVAGDSYANCDGSIPPWSLTAGDFQCFLYKFAGGCP
jgi:outer membrane protein assembly factor BamB